MFLIEVGISSMLSADKILKPDLFFAQKDIEVYISDYTENLKPDYKCDKKIQIHMIKFMVLILKIVIILYKMKYFKLYLNLCK